MSRNNIVLELPMESLTLINSDGQPTPKEIRKLTSELYTCAAAVPSTLGGGNHGHIGQIMPAADYAALIGAAVVAWVPQALPQRPQITAAMQDHQITNRQDRFKNETAHYETAQALERKLTKMILEAVPDEYLSALKHAMTGYAGVSVARMLVHLNTTYGAITEDDLEKNEASLDTPWDPSTPTETAFSHADACQEFALAGEDEISDHKYIRANLKKFEASGVLEDACSDWRKKAVGDRTKANMKTHFRRYNQDRLRRLSAADVGFGNAAANAAQEAVPETIEQVVARMLAAQGGTNRNGNQGRQGGQVNPNQLMACIHYCWTHGLGRDPNHTSPTCTRQANGHRCDATLDNMMGGNDKIRRARGDRAIYRPPNRGNNTNNGNGGANNGSGGGANNGAGE